MRPGEINASKDDLSRARMQVFKDFRKALGFHRKDRKPKVSARLRSVISLIANVPVPARRLRNQTPRNRRLTRRQGRVRKQRYVRFIVSNVTSTNLNVTWPGTAHAASNVRWEGKTKGHRIQSSLVAELRAWK